MKDRASDEQKAESTKLKAVMERHKTLIPKIQETLVKTECYWKCYSYGDDLIPIFEFIDDLRNRWVAGGHTRIFLFVLPGNCLDLLKRFKAVTAK